MTDPSINTGRRAPGSTLSRLRRDGTFDIVAGSLVAGLAALAYEAIGGRRLGAVGFAPISALLTLHFLVFIVVLLPLEQVTIRRLTIDRDRPGVPIGAVSVIAASTVIAGLVAYTARDRFFGGDGIYAIVLAASVVTHGVFVLSRGALAGRRRYRSYGISSGAAALLRLAVAGAALGIAASASWYAAALAIGPLAVLAWRPFSSAVDEPRRDAAVVDAGAREGAILAGLMLAAAASQALLLAGPVVAILAGATPAAVSILFVVFSLARAPLSLGYNLVARVLGPLTEMAEQGQHRRLSRLTGRIAVATIVAAVLAAVAGEWAGPAIVTAIFGPAFRPDPLIVAAVAAGVAVAAGSLVAGQIFVARGDTGRLADAWIVATIVAAALVFVLPHAPAPRVALAFVGGEAAALALLTRMAYAAPAESPGRSMRRGLYPAAKRVFDVVAGVVLAVVTAPILLAALAAVLVTDGRPVLIRQTRVGRNRAPFRMWKIRSMAIGADSAVFDDHIARLAGAAVTGSGEQPRLRIPDDPRLTSVGRRLRRWSIDELPNLWNVVTGDMSLVGPRPLLPEEDALVVRHVPPEVAAARASVAPGITGLAQVEGRDDITMAERAGLDARYAAQRSFSLDLWLLLRTAISIFRFRGA